MNEGRTGALRRFVDERMAAMGIASLVELADISDIGRDTLYAWFRGRPPTARAGGRVARSLGVSYRELLDAYEGKERGEAPSDLASLVAAMAAQTTAITALVMEMRSLVPHQLENRLAVLEGRLPMIEGEVRELRALGQALHPELLLQESQVPPVPRKTGG